MEELKKENNKIIKKKKKRKKREKVRTKKDRRKRGKREKEKETSHIASAMRGSEMRWEDRSAGAREADQKRSIEKEKDVVG